MDQGSNRHGNSYVSNGVILHTSVNILKLRPTDINHQHRWFTLLAGLVMALNIPNEIPDKKGLAPAYLVSSDIALLGANWFYAYGLVPSLLNDPKYVPMLVEGLPEAALPSSYSGNVLVFSEPDNPGTGGHSVDPVVAAQRYANLLVEYPYAKFIVGGVTEANTQWAASFLAGLTQDQYPDRWHLHKYVWAITDLQSSIDVITDFHELVSRPLWITETGSPAGSVEALGGAMLWMETTPWIERYAVFTNRIEGDESWWPSHWNVDMALIDYETGQLTAMGMRYKNLEMHEIFLPLVVR